jgi:hypothetical protein
MNQVRILAFTALAVALAVTLVGCGRSGYVPVSGVLKVNGKPYRNALVQFQPIASSDNPNPGRASAGYTDENGQFKLKTDDGHQGAVVSRHRVRITTKYSDKLHGYEVWDASLNKAVKAASDPIPPEWSYESKKEFEVPPGGTDHADFDVLTKK